jgi:FixJ family two-component response regulator
MDKKLNEKKNLREKLATVFIVDDDPSVRKSLQRLLTVSGYRTEVFGSAQEFLQIEHTQAPACLILDVRLPGLDGLELQNMLGQQWPDLPIVFITGHGDIPMSVKAMKEGAIDFLSKPFSEETLLCAVEHAIEKSRREVALLADIAGIRGRLALLTPREREVLQHVSTGRLNKQIAADMGVTEKTVKVHRGRVMQKLRAQSIVELVRMLQKLERPGKIH